MVVPSPALSNSFHLKSAPGTLLLRSGKIKRACPSQAPRTSHSLCITRSALMPTQLAPYLPPLLGGLSLGVLALGKLVVSGRVLGISGAVKGLVGGDLAPWRLLFLSGLLTGGFALCGLYPAAFETAPLSGGIARYIVAGLLVGVGTALGNGCTSGHGICGNARLSPRSIASTLTFMLTGALAVSAMQTNQHLGLPTGFITSPTPTAELLKFASAILTASVALLAGVAFTANAVKAKSSPPAATWLDLFFEFASGTLFALGLGISGMTRPSKVSGFLAVFSNAFDPSLMFVMGGALLVALPGYQLVLRSGIIKQPLCAVEFKIPGKSDIDARLLVGAALFGAGWGTAGICPGPGIVALATQQTPIYVFVVSVIAGMMLSSRIEGLQMVKQP